MYRNLVAFCVIEEMLLLVQSVGNQVGSHDFLRDLAGAEGRVGSRA